MSMLKSQKMELVDRLKKDLGAYRTVAVMPIDSLPDNLLQKVRSQLKGSKIIITRKTLMDRALKESGFERLDQYIQKNIALILTNDDPTSLNRIVHSNRLRLAAKPNQIAPSDISIEAGETSIAPGQTVTDLKNAGIDVRIDKGKVVISKGKVLVAKGSKISGAVANALKILEVKPFELSPRLSAALSDKLLFNELALSVDEEYSRNETVKAFREAYAISLEIGMVTEYNVGELMTRAYRGAIAVGLEAGSPEPEITKMLIANAAAQAGSISANVKAEAPVAPAS